MLTELAGWVKWNGVIKYVVGYVCKTFYVIEGMGQIGDLGIKELGN